MASDDEIPELSEEFAAATGTPLLVEQGQINTLVNAYADARIRREGLDAQAKEAKAIENSAAVALFDAMERHGLRSARHARGLFSLDDLAWASIDDRAAAVAWAEAKMPEALTLNTQKMSALVRAVLKGEEGAEMPAGVGYRIGRSIKWRRG